MEILYSPIKPQEHDCTDDLIKVGRPAHSNKMTCFQSAYPRNTILKCVCGKVWITRMGNYARHWTLVELKWYHLAGWKITDA